MFFDYMSMRYRMEKLDARIKSDEKKKEKQWKTKREQHVMIPSPIKASGKTNRSLQSNSQDDKQLLFTVAQVAGFLRVSTDTVYRAINAGKLSCRRIGRRIRVTQDDVIEYMEEHIVCRQQKGIV